MWYLWLLLGVLVGCVITNVFYLVMAGRGTFKIDHSNPEKDVVRLELKDCVWDLIFKKKKKFLYIRIDHNADLSR